MIDTLPLTAQQVNDLLAAGEASSDEIFSAYRAAIDERDAELNSFLHVCDDSTGEGIPIAFKDVISTKGIPTTAGSKSWLGRKSDSIASVVAQQPGSASRPLWHSSMPTRSV